MRGFVVHPTYKIVEDTTYVILTGRLENGDSFMIQNECKPYFYIRKKDVQKALGFARFDYEETELLNFDKEDVVKVIVNTPKDVPPLRKELEGIATYESDVRFAYRCMIDMGVRGGLEIPKEFEKSFEKGEHVDRVYVNIPVRGSESFEPNLRILSFDIETDMEASQVYCISIVCGKYKRVLMLTDDTKLKNVDTFSSEKELLQAFQDKVLELDPDVITGWNFIDFDLPVIQRRMKAHKMKMDLGRIPGYSTKLRIESNFLSDSKADIPGRMALDGIHMLKANFIKLEDYKLETAAQEFLGKGKLLHGAGRFTEIEDLYKTNQQKLADYNLLDSQLVLEIIENQNLLGLSTARSFLTGMQLDRVSAAVASLDSMYLRESKEMGLVCPASSFSDDGEYERIKGGYVMDPAPGIYDYVLVLDFKSLYPSVIRTFNLDPLSKSEHGTIVAPNDVRFLNTTSILPSILERLAGQREKAKKAKDDAASYAIKITMNSVFGVLANPACRFYDLDVANAITSFGRYIIHETSELLEQEGYKVIYGDTDSVFVDAAAKNGDEANKIGKKIEKSMNTYWTSFVKNDFKRESVLELEFEKMFERFILPKTRHGEGGAKKRYAGLRIVDGKEKLDFTGLEFVRRDWTDLAKDFQLELLDRVFHKKEVTDYVKQYVKDLQAGKLDDKLVYKKAIRKPLHEYTKTSPPHVKAARKIKGKMTSNLIRYYMTLDGPEPIEELKSKIDYDHYTEKQLKPIADTILVFFNTNFDDLIKGSSQTTLFGFE